MSKPLLYLMTSSLIYAKWQFGIPNNHHSRPQALYYLTQAFTTQPNTPTSLSYQEKI